MKSEIIERLGQSDILLPSLIAEGLAANDRVKARLSVLQGAGRHAQDPGGPRLDLTGECRAAGLDASAMNALINGTVAVGSDQVSSTGLGELRASLWDDVAEMIRAVGSDDAGRGDAALARLEAIKQSAGSGKSDTIELACIAQLTGLSEGKADSLHRLIMDMHKALNRLSTAHAEEVLAGAHVYGLLPEDRSAVTAFMCGIEQTCKLKFNHPGLATTATRCGTRLTIQNDIGETDAHVVVIGVEAHTVTVTYTDVHLARAKFFTGLLHDFPVEWSGLDRKSAEGLGDDGVFYLVTGTYRAKNAKQRDAFLEAAGATLVFLIDWNKARKVLRGWVSKADAIQILDWAARHRFGHRAFLELGGSELVAAAVHHATPTRIGFGERLDRALGRDAAVDFLKTVLRVSAEAMVAGGSTRLARDRIEADLVRHLQRVGSTVLATVVRQAGLARALATGIAQFIADRLAARPCDTVAFAARARSIEEKADRIAIDARNEIARYDADPAIAQLVDRIEDAIDELEQAAFISSLMPPDMPEELLRPLADVAAAAVTGAGSAAMGAAAAADVPDGQRIDSEDALAAVGRLIDAEHNGDDAERAVTAIVLRGDFDLKTTLAALELARAMERATDRLAGFGHLLRRHVLADLSV